MGLIRLALRRAQSQIRYIQPVRPAAAKGVVAEVYRQVERDFGMLAPPISLHSPAPDVLAASWLMLRETLIASGKASRAVKEVVASAVSEANACPYCVEVHSSVVDTLGRPADADPVAEWAAGRAVAPFDAAQAPELTGVAVTFHYLNRMVNVFLDSSPLPPEVPAHARGVARWVLGRVVRSTSAIPAGGSLPLLPEAELPADLSWAAGNDVVAHALARAAAAIEAAADRFVPPAVRELVRSELAAWRGEPPALDRSWLDRPLAALPADERAAGRLALLTALASYRVGPSEIAEFRRGATSDRELVALTAWASLAAARRVSALLAGSVPHQTDRPFPVA